MICFDYLITQGEYLTLRLLGQYSGIDKLLSHIVVLVKRETLRVIVQGKMMFSEAPE